MPSHIKGTAIQVYLDWLRARVAAAEVVDILARLSPSTLKVTLDRVLPSQQYDYQLYAEILEASEEVLGPSFERLAFEHGRYAADVLLSDVYQLTVKRDDVERTLQSLAIGWRFFFDTGAIQITEHKAGSWVFVIVDARYHPLHPPISAGYVQRACEIAGATNVHVAIDGSPPQVKMVITWSSTVERSEITR